MTTYTYYFPVFGYNTSFAPPKIHSFQLGWWYENRVPVYEQALGLTHGGDQHLLAPENTLQTVQVVEWFIDYNERWSLPYLPPHLLTYSKTEKRFLYPDAAQRWIADNPGKRYLIGNEPDGPYEGGGCDMTPSEYADFAHVAITLIREADISAQITMGAWAGGVGESYYPANNEHKALYYYQDRYGTMDVDAVSFHAYQSGLYNYPYPNAKLAKFASYARLWHNNGWTKSSDICLTEFGWHGLDVANNTSENCMKFMDWYIPFLRDHEQVIGWWWWQWGPGAMLMSGDEVTEVGRHYGGMR
jgi:hypothetical protein